MVCPADGIVYVVMKHRDGDLDNRPVVHGLDGSLKEVVSLRTTFNGAKTMAQNVAVQVSRTPGGVNDLRPIEAWSTTVYAAYGVWGLFAAPAAFQRAEPGLEDNGTYQFVLVWVEPRNLVLGGGERLVLQMS